MTVLLVSEPGKDGVFRFVESLAHYLVGQAVQVHFAYSDRRSCERLQTLVNYIRENGGAVLNLATGNRPDLADLPALQALRGLARTVQPDIIHSHSSKAGVLARALGSLGVHAPQVYQPHAYAGMKPQFRLLRLFYEGIERVLGRRSVTITCSEDEQAYAAERLQLPPDRTVFIPNSVDIERFRPASSEEKQALRRRFEVPPHATVLGTLGRTSVQKDPLTLYRAFARAREQEPDLVLFHLGSGELDGEVNRFIHERRLQRSILRLDYLSAPEDFYRMVDGFMLTSLYEGMSLAALEALASDLPLILSEAPGNHSLIRMPLTHLWSAPIGDVNRFARAITHWAASQRPTTPPWPSNHRSVALAQFDSRANLSRVLELYRTLQAA